jgi:hypothetical protein
MSQASQQLREALMVEFPGIRIGRKACRNTAGGSVSQHSAYYYGSYDSNAIDIMGAPLIWKLSYRETQEYLDEVYEWIDGHRHEWSIRVMFWRIADHFGHIHCDFWPTCEEAKWCGRHITPRWSYSSGNTFIAEDPDPENGEYHGPQEEDMTAVFNDWVEGWVAGLDEEHVRKLHTAGVIRGDVEYWVALLQQPDDPAWRYFYPRAQASVWSKIGA